MRLLVESAIVFFGTLMAAALVALAGPGVVELRTTPSKSAAQLLASTQPSGTHAATAQRPAR